MSEEERAVGAAGAAEQAVVHPLKGDIVMSGIRQYRIAQRLKISPSLLNLWLNGQRPMPQEMEERIRNILAAA